MRGFGQIQRLVPGWFGMAALVLALVGGSGVTAASTPEHRARAFIEGLAEQAISALSDDKASRAERERQARVLLNENFAVPSIAQWVLGRYWRVATPEERVEYLQLFEDLIVFTYVDRFSRYSGERLNVYRTATAADGGDVMVYSQIIRDTGPPFEVGWRVRETAAGPKIIDVFVEGVSMGQTQRSEFASVIQQHGGQVAGLLAEMRRRIAAHG